MATTTWKTDEATQAQIGFLRTLAKERQGTEAIVARLEILEDHPMTKGEASQLISAAKAMPVKPSAPKSAPTQGGSGHKYDEPVVGKGYFTVKDEDTGTHRTFRVSPEQSWCDGKTVISLLTGSSNTSSYTGIGFVTNEGVQLWKKYSSDTPLAKSVDRLVADARGAAQLTLEMAKQHVLTSENCYVCGKLLTDPDSIEAGIGPVCRGLVTGWANS